MFLQQAETNRDTSILDVPDSYRSAALAVEQLDAISQAVVSPFGAGGRLGLPHARLGDQGGT